VSNRADEVPGTVAGQAPLAPSAGGALTRRRVALAFLAWIVLSALAAAVTVLLAEASTAPDTVAALIVAEVYVLLVGSLVAAYRPIRVAVEAYGLRLRWRDAVAGVLVGGLASGAALLAYAAVKAWGPFYDALVWVGRDGGRLGSVPVVIAIICVVRGTVIAPMAEELLFRGALFRWLRRRLGAWPTIVLTAALWAVAHFGIPAAMPYAFVVGLGLGWLRERRGSVMPGLIYHILHNGVLFLAVYTTVGW